jgi:hypothetical protein
MNILVSTIALALGLFITSAPAQAARVWSAGRMEKLAPARRVWFLRAYRTLGVMMLVTGVLFALDSFPRG